MNCLATKMAAEHAVILCSPMFSLLTFWLEPSLRRACLRNIITYLDGRSPTAPLTLTECLQLWRGFYVALYMHDSKNPLSVQKLTAELAGTLRTMDGKDQQLADAADTPGCLWLETWTTAFWETVCREWAAIDQWRINKMLLLIRFFIIEQFNLVLNHAVDDGAAGHSAIARQISVLEAWPFSSRERKVPDGLRLHVLDVWVDELVGQLSKARKAIDEEEGDDSETKQNAILTAAKDLMEPVRKLSREALSKGVKIRAKEAVKQGEDGLPG